MGVARGSGVAVGVPVAAGRGEAVGNWVTTTGAVGIEVGVEGITDSGRRQAARAIAIMSSQITRAGRWFPEEGVLSISALSALWRVV